MGYYTHFTLKIKSPETKINMECSHCKGTGEISMTPYEAVIKEYPDMSEENLDDSQKWYSYNEDMLKISKSFPKMLFVLNGDGEERTDLWKNYYKNGRVQETKIEVNFDLDDFDEDKLK